MLYNPGIQTNLIISMISTNVESAKSQIDYIVGFESPFVEFPTYHHNKFKKQRLDDSALYSVSLDTNRILAMRSDLTLNSGGSSSIDVTIDIQELNRL